MAISFLKKTVLCAATIAATTFANAAPKEYVIDPTHTYPSFEADHFGGLSIWRGKFNKNSGTVTYDKQAQTGTVNIVVDTNSIDFGLDAMNDKAKGVELFNVEKYPTATYQGKLTDFVDGKPTKVTGQLTMLGKTQPVDLTINSFKCIFNPIIKKQVCGADAKTTFKRDAFGMDFGKLLGFNMDVTLQIQVEAIAQ